MKSCIKLFIILIFNSISPKIEANVVLINDFIKLVSHDDSFVKITSFKFYKKSRDVAALNVTYVTMQDIVSDEQVKISVAAFQLRGNEFKKTVIDFTVGICTLYRANKFDSMSLVKNSNLTGCPFPKGGYYINDVSPTADLLPPFFPEGKWMIDFNFLGNGRKVAHVQWMMTVLKKV